MKTNRPSLPLIHGPLYFPDAGDTPDPSTEETTEEQGGGTPEVTAEELEQLRAAAAELAELKKRPDPMMFVQKAFGKDVSEDERLEASARLLQAAGYSEDEIVNLLADEEEPQPTRNNTRDTRGQQGGGDAMTKELMKELRELKAQIAEQGKMTTEQRYKRLTDIHTRSIEQELTAGEVAKVVAEITKGMPEKEKAEVLATLRGDVVQSSREILRQRRDQAGNQLDEAWIPEAVKQAAAQAAKKVRLFGGGSRVGPSTELELADESFLKQPEKKLPADPRKVEDPERTLDEYNADALGRVVAEARAAQGKSAV